MGLLKNLLPAIGVALALFGVGLVVKPEETVQIVLGGKVLKGSMFAWSALGSFKFGFGMLAIFSRNWWGRRFPRPLYARACILFTPSMVDAQTADERSLD